MTTISVRVKIQKKVKEHKKKRESWDDCLERIIKEWKFFKEISKKA